MRAMLCTMVLALAAPVGAKASTSAGIEIDLGRFKVRVYYGVALEYGDHADAAVTDPRAMLFALATRLQANAKGVAGVDTTLVLELTRRVGADETFLEVREDPAGRDVVRWDRPVSGDVVAAMLDRICDASPAACALPAREELVLYRCSRSRCPGQIRFGSFPSAGVNRRFSLLPQRGAAAKGVVARREDVGRYFEALE